MSNNLSHSNILPESKHCKLSQKLISPTNNNYFSYNDFNYRKHSNQFIKKKKMRNPKDVSYSHSSKDSLKYFDSDSRSLSQRRCETNHHHRKQSSREINKNKWREKNNHYERRKDNGYKFEKKDDNKVMFSRYNGLKEKNLEENKKEDYEERDRNKEKNKKWNESRINNKDKKRKAERIRLKNNYKHNNCINESTGEEKSSSLLNNYLIKAEKELSFQGFSKLGK